MNTDRRSQSQITSKVVGIYEKLFQGLSPEQIHPHDDPRDFYSNLLDLDVDREYLQGLLNRVSKDACLGRLKPVLNELFRSSTLHARKGKGGNVKRAHALETLSLIIRCVLAKNLTGWEVMEILAGGASQSDAVFLNFTEMINEVLAELSAPADIRHRVLQLALTYMCGVAQLSPGAYFLRYDMFPAIATFIKTPDTEQFTFEAVLLLAVLANYHKSDAAKLNPYLKCIRETKDEDLMRKICWASNFALEAATKAYQAISDDTVSPTFSMALGSMIASWRPDRAFASAPVDPPRELFKSQPIEASVMLLPMFEFIRANAAFSAVLVNYISQERSQPGRLSPTFTILSLSSYILTHATSTSSPRSIAYANLSLNILLALAENDKMMNAFCHPTTDNIHLCRQRLPVLPIAQLQRAPMCALLDCCVLWLRHNLHKRLEVHSYLNCIWICHRVIWYLQRNHIRLEYDWKGLWTAILGLLNFLSTKLDTSTSMGVDQLVRETMAVLDLALSKSETYLPSPYSVHEFIYELVRSSSTIKKQGLLLDTLATQSIARASWSAEQPTDTLAYVVEITDYYEKKVSSAGARTAKEAMRVVAKDIEADGLHGSTTMREMELPTRSEDVLGFGRFACVDGLSLMP